jgi:nucleoside-diphosphate-sugar epimerase
MEKIFVTGANGLIGSNLCHRLAESGYDVVGLVREGSNLTGLKGFQGKIVRGDFLEENSLAGYLEGIDFVFHTAGLVSFDNRKRDALLRVNVEGVRSVVSAALKAGVRRLVHTSSVAAIGIPAVGDTADESVGYNRFTYDVAYGDSKHFGEIEIKNGIERGLDAVIVNPGSVIGQRDVYFHSGILLKVLKGMKIVPYVSGGMCVVGVDDVVDGEIAALKTGKKGERYILGSENVTFKELFGRICEVVGAPSPGFRVPAWGARLAASFMEVLSGVTGKPPLLTKAHVVSATLPHYFSSGKAVRELGYRPRPIIDAIRKSYQWYIENGLM